MLSSIPIPLPPPASRPWDTAHGAYSLCPQCQRQRMHLRVNGLHACEKCEWCPEFGYCISVADRNSNAASGSPPPDDEGLAAAALARGVRWLPGPLASEALVRICNTCKAVTAIDYDDTEEHRSTMPLRNQTVCPVPRIVADAVGPFATACNCPLEEPCVIGK